MSPQDSVNVAEALIEAFNAHDLGRVESLASEGFFGLAPDSPEPRMGRKGGRAWVEAILSAFPDGRLVRERVFGQDNTFVAEVVFEGTHAGSLQTPVPAPPTQRQVRIPATFIGRVQGGQILDLRGYWDLLGLLQQLGMAPRSPGASSQ